MMGSKMTRVSFLAIFLLGACSSIIPGILRFQDREYVIDSKSASLIYPTYVTKCKYPKRKILRGCYKKRVIIKHDLNDPAERNNFNKAKFSCKSPMRFKYD